LKDFLRKKYKEVLLKMFNKFNKKKKFSKEDESALLNDILNDNLEDDIEEDYEKDIEPLN